MKSQCSSGTLLQHTAKPLGSMSRGAVVLLLFVNNSMCCIAEIPGLRDIEVVCKGCIWIVDKEVIEKSCFVLHCTT